MDKTNMLRCGVVTQTHGIAGEVKVFPTMDELEHFKKLKTVVVDLGREEKKLTISSVKFFKNQVILKFKEYKDINEVMEIVKKELWIDRSQAIPCEEDENFITDLIGLTVVNDEEVPGISVESEEGHIIGECSDVLQTGANDVYVVTLKNGKEALLPAIKQVILKVDLEKKIMYVKLLKGIID